MVEVWDVGGTSEGRIRGRRGETEDSEGRIRGRRGETEDELIHCRYRCATGEHFHGVNVCSTSINDDHTCAY